MFCGYPGTLLIDQTVVGLVTVHARGIAALSSRTYCDRVSGHGPAENVLRLSVGSFQVSLLGPAPGVSHEYVRRTAFKKETRSIFSSGQDHHGLRPDTSALNW